MVLPGRRAPLAIPALIMLNAALSLTEPPGLNHSALAQNSTLGKSAPILESRNKGVLPISSMTDCPDSPMRISSLAGAALVGSAIWLMVAMLFNRLQASLICD